MDDLASIGNVDAARSPTLPALTSEPPPTVGDHSTEPKNGTWHYRFRNPLFALLEQLARRFGVETPRLAQYNRSPRKTLKLIANDCDLRPESVRRCLEVALNGAPISTRQGAIPSILASASGETGWGRAQGRLRAQRLVRDRDFLGLLRDINHARAVIVHQWPRSPDGFLINDAGASIDDKAGNAAKLARFLDGAEAAVLTAVRGELGEAIEVTSAGWSTPTRLNVRRLKTRIQRRTGYQISVAGRRRKV
ncbi:MAG: hypothetical protein WCB10_11220 [Steroidobacteraceae bacterium]